MNWPAIPPIKANGKNTTTLVPTPAKTETATFFVPSMAESSGCLPARISWRADSIKIIAFDTNVPSAEEYASNVIALIVKPEPSIKKKPAINDAGITTPAIMVERQFPVNASKTKTVNIIPSTIPQIVLYVSSKTDIDESDVIIISAPGKRVCMSVVSAGRRSRRALEILMALPSSAFTTDATTTSSPL